MSKRVNNAKGQPSRNKAHGRLRLKREIREAIRRKQHDALTEAAILEAKKAELKKARKVQKVSFKSRVREFFTRSPRKAA